MKQILLIFALVFLCGGLLVQAQWSTDPTVNTPICTAANNQGYPTIVSDGAGGAIITWWDLRGGTNYDDIYAQRINAEGIVQWTTDGVSICTAVSVQEDPKIVSDGVGGAIITWIDHRSGNFDIYAQRINAEGKVQWTTDGVPISTPVNDQYFPTIVSDEAGGAIITWNDYRSGRGPGYSDIYAQRINAAGVVRWTANGVPISTAVNDQEHPTIVGDSAGGAIITWHDYRSGMGADIYAQRINAEGKVQWTADGVPICTDANIQLTPTITNDGAGGAIITWKDYRDSTGYSDIYAQRINAAGEVQWTADGVPISTAANDQDYPTIVSDGTGSAIITWMDWRSGSHWEIYAQRINAAGLVQWAADGVPISTAGTSPTITSDGASGAIITWATLLPSTDIYAQQINAAGLAQWTTGGVPVSTAVKDQAYPTIISDSAGGAIIT
jgi:predicted lipoprotein with Yx(FWY)xxD motif